MVPVILSLVVESWEDMLQPASDETEDHITISLYRILRQNKAARELPFRINIQRFELDALSDKEHGRQDIVFEPLHPCEDIYFCLESKRLNVVKDGKPRAYASEYVTHGMLRFVTGQYSKAVRHGGMLGYVLDGNISGAITNVEANIRKRHFALCMVPPGGFVPSSALADHARARETHHQRAHEASLFRIHHLFMAAGRPARPLGWLTPDP
ncbi:MAG: hypothetical protein JJE04_14295 [Acidobacteriia bacterium]|nr:hypothetical protein [Terriglobia bacterium]